MAEIKLTTDNFESEVLKSDKPVLVDFWAEWCGPCKSLSPIIEELAKEYREIKVGKVNVDEEQELVSKFEIMGIPTLLVFKEGKVVNRAVGTRSKQQILELI